MKLFKRIEPSFEKVAKKTSLSDNEATWPNEMIAALYKQHDFLGSFEVNMRIEEQDDNLGYLYGSFVVNNPTDRAITQNSQSFGAEQQKQMAPDASEIRIPVIVEDGKLFSFDVFITPEGGFQPLTQDRVESILFSSAPYNAVPVREAMPLAQPGSTGMTPAVPNGGIGTSRGGVVKTASLLDVVLPLSSKTAKEVLVKTAATSPWIMDMADKKTAVSAALVKIAQNVNVQPSTKTLSSDDFEVALLTKVAGGYEITLATNCGHTAPAVHITNAEAAFLPHNAKREALREGAALLTSNEEGISKFAQEQIPDLDFVKEAGVYDLVLPGGETTRSLVFDVQSLSGVPMSVKLALSNSGSSFQNDIAGVKLAQLDNIPKVGDAVVRGTGVFHMGGSTVSEPLTILNRIDREGRESIYHCSDTFGVPYTLTKTSAAKVPIQVEEGHYLIPSSYGWVELTKEAKFLSDPYVIQKMASVVDEFKSVTVLAAGNEFSFSGGCGVEKLASEDVKYPRALLIMGLLGASPDDARNMLKEASENISVTFVPGRSIEESSITKTAVQTFSDEDISFMPELDFLKLAAALRNQHDTVDTVLSLNFVTPENLAAYVEYSDVLEECLGKLSEMLIGVRMGVPDIKENAVLSALKGMTKVVDGLKELSMRSQAPETV